MKKRIVLFRNNAGWQQLWPDTGNILPTGFGKETHRSIVKTEIQKLNPDYEVDAMGQEVLGESDLHKFYQHIMAIGRKG